MIKRVVKAVGVVVVLSFASTWAGCLCTGSGNRERDTRTPLQRCIGACTMNLSNCNLSCNHDPQCARACAEGNQVCLRSCDKHDGSRVR